MAMRTLRATAAVSLAALASHLLAPGSAAAESGSDESLRAEMETLRRENDGLRARLDELERQVTALGGGSPAGGTGGDALEEAIRGLEGAPTPSAPTAGPSSAVAGPRLMDVSLVANTAGGTSTATDSQLQLLQLGDHDPRQRGFTLQAAELSLLGAVDPYLNAEAHLVYLLDPAGESQVEIEEVFMTTQALPENLQLEVGQFLTEFGRINPRHAHAWQWVDQPVIVSRLFGPDGMRNPGFQLSWLAPLPWFSEVWVGSQNARGETMVSFLGSDGVYADVYGDDTGVGGRPFVDVDVGQLQDLVYLARWQNAFGIGENVSGALGVSGAFGPNSSGDSGRTRIYGADLVAKWRPSGQRHGWPFVELEAEYMYRDYYADSTDTLPSDTLRDYGFYVQALWGFRPRWAAGLRYEWAGSSGASLIAGGTAADPLRDDRIRISPLLAFSPSEYSRIRLQYNYDRADFLERSFDDPHDDAHTVWLNFEFGLGAHPSHGY